MTNMHVVPPVPEQGDSWLARYSSSIIDWSTFWDAEFQIAEWCVEPVLPLGRSIAIYSRAGGGKSLFTLDLIARLATGQRILDRRAGPPLRVAYFDLEMTEGDLYERLDDMGYGRQADLSHLTYFMLPDLPPLDTPAGGEAVVGLVSELQANVVVFDTTSRVISGKENDSDTLLALYRHTGRPLKEMGCTTVRLDHAGKDLDRGQRGSSAKNDDVDLVWELRPREGGLTLHAKKRRQSWIPEHVDIVRQENPLRHELAADGAIWPAGTQACAESLDRLGAPLDLGVRAAQKLLREASAGVRTEVLSAALKYRRMGSEESGNTTGNAQTFYNGNSDGERPETGSGNTRETPGNTLGGEWETRFLSREEPVSPPKVCSSCQNNPADDDQSRPDLCKECWMAELNAMLDDGVEEPEPDDRVVPLWADRGDA